jgi:hypothetical protein
VINGTLPHRGVDSWGSGKYHASRGTYKRGPKKGQPKLHRGVDYLCYPNTQIHSITAGTCIKLGYPYGDDLSYRYVRILDRHGAYHDYFYIQPHVPVGAIIKVGSMIGFTQDLQRRYKDIPNHVHYQVIVGSEDVNPETYRE